MELTGICKENFNKWFMDSYPYKEFVFYSDNIKCTYITEFFDSIKIYILINIDADFYYEIERGGFTFRKRGFGYNSRLLANKEAIIKVNEMYNDKQTL